jgi:hypothetical protein
MQKNDFLDSIHIYKGTAGTSNQGQPTMVAITRFRTLQSKHTGETHLG